MVDSGETVDALATVGAGFVVLELHVHAPMHAVLHLPVAVHRVRDRFSIRLDRTNPQTTALRDVADQCVAEFQPRTGFEACFASSGVQVCRGEGPTMCLAGRPVVQACRRLATLLSVREHDHCC